MSSRLPAILASRRARLASVDAAALARAAATRSDRGGAERFAAALRRPGIRLIAEVKRQSPSKGWLAPEGFDPVRQAQAYARGGAAAISVVVEQDHFAGDPAWVPAIRTAVDVPLLWKDFVVSSTVLDQAAVAGADAALLIVAALEPSALADLIRHGEQLGLGVLVETHDATEACIAIDAGARIIGVNARNLHTFAVDLEAAAAVAKALPTSAIRVAESGISNRADVDRLRAAGYDAFLVGEALMRAADAEEAVRRLVE